MTSLLRKIERMLEDGWFSRFLLIFQFWIVYRMLDWSWAFASTALATKADLVGTAAVIGAVAAVPQALLLLATNKYMELRSTEKRPTVIQDRRSAA